MLFLNSDALITSFCDKFKLAMVSVIAQLVQDGVDDHDIASVMKSISIDDIVVIVKDDNSDAIVEPVLSKPKLADHCYDCDTPRTMKRCLNEAIGALDST